MIEDFSMNLDLNSVTWSYQNKTVMWDVTDLDQAIVYSEHQKVYVLSERNQLPGKLDVLDWEGKLVFSCSPPQKSDFYYLTKSSSNSVLIVCSFDEALDGWRDWHYFIDFEKKQLTRGAPAY